MRAIGLAVIGTCLIVGIAAAQAQDCSDIRGKICSMKAFNPDPSGTDAAGSPQCVDPGSEPANLQDQKNAIQAAYDLAPGLVKEDLCRISRIFIIQSGQAHSWGRWEDPKIHQSTGGATQIALHKDDLFGKSFADKQDDHLSDLGLGAHAKHPAGTVPSRLSPQTLGLLYMLVHELGHIRWHRDAGIGEPVGCVDDPYFFSWGDLNSARTNRWTKFGDESLGDHRHNVPKPKQVSNSDKLKSIYTGGFVTAVAAANPEEDFVETYAVKTVMEVCPQCIFNIQIGTGANQTTIKVNDDGGNPILKAKFNCAAEYIKPSGP